MTNQEIKQQMVQELEQKLYRAESDLIDLKKQQRWSWYVVVIEIISIYTLYFAIQILDSSLAAEIAFGTVIIGMGGLLIILFFVTIYSFLRALANMGLYKVLIKLIFKDEKNTNKYLQQETKDRIQRLREKLKKLEEKSED